MIPPDQSPATDGPNNIYSRLLTAISSAKQRRGILGKHAAEVSPALYLGSQEWIDLSALLAKWGVEWRGAGTKYDPASIEENRAEFVGVKIYRVDASQHLTAV